MEVRCCCQPKKLLGWLPVPAVGVRQVVIPCLPASMLSQQAAEGQRVSGFSQKLLPVESITVDGEAFKAIKAEGMEMAELKKIKAFIPNE